VSVSELGRRWEYGVLAIQRSALSISIVLYLATDVVMMMVFHNGGALLPPFVS
jgi:hypothetical protein